MIKKGLGKGLGALITSAENEDSGVKEIRINDIEPNTHQPRKKFEDEKLQQLAESIKQHGIIQPLIVQKEDEIYRIVAGERRWRAARIAGIDRVPVIIKEYNNKQVMEVALIENIQRQDLNPIEEAEAYEKLLSEYNLTQEQLSTSVGKSRPAIANTLRLLNLTEKVKQMLIIGDLSSGHARAILSVEDKELQDKIAEEIVKNNLNVRDTEKLVKKHIIGKAIRKKEEGDDQYIEIEEKLKQIFSTKVKIFANQKKGKIMIEYYSPEELERLLEMVKKLE